MVLQSCAPLQAWDVHDWGSHGAGAVGLLTDDRPEASAGLGWLVCQRHGGMLCPRALTHWDEVVSVVWPLHLSDEETETHTLAHRILSKALSTTAGHQREHPWPTLPASFIYLWFMSSTLPFMDLYFCIWVFCHIKKVQVSKSELWKNQTRALMWVLALCLQWSVEGPEAEGSLTPNTVMWWGQKMVKSINTQFNLGKI